MSLSRIASDFRDKRRFKSKIANFSHPRVPLGIGYWRWESAN